MGSETHKPRTSPAREQAEAEAAKHNPPADPPTPDAPAAIAPAEAPKAATPAEPKSVAPRLNPRLIDAIAVENPSIRNEECATLLAEACYVFGVNPDPKLKPRELAAFRYDSGEPDGTPPIPAYVSMVTAGGSKIKYPIDDDTEYKLRIIYNAFRVNKATGDKEVLPLPADLTLPRQYVDGIVRSNEHVYRTGYLQSGGKVEADRRAAAIQTLRNAGKIR